MEQIKYRKTLDVHKNGTQFLLQGFETADKLSRVIEISLMASGDAIDFPLERIVAMMYVTTPGATEPSINECTIKDNKVVYEVLPIIEEGLTTMQLKLIETSPDGATSVLASPKFAVEVTKSDVDDEGAEQTTTFTALEDAMAKAKTVYDERFLRMELTSDCTFKAYYADGTVYETDILKKLFLNGNVLLSESFAHGGTGVRAGEDTDNSMYYSNVSKSESLNAKAIMENSEEILEEVKLHGMYTAFSVDFETGEVEYVSPSFKFRVNIETGELEVDGQTYTFDDEVARVVTDWLAINGVFISDLQAISETHTEEIAALKKTTSKHTEDIKQIDDDIDALRNDIESMEWTTIGSVAYSNSAEQHNAIAEKETVNIPIDENVLKEFTLFRYIIKKGASFSVQGTSTTRGTQDSGVKIISNADRTLLAVGCQFYIDDDADDDYTLTDSYSYEVAEDLIIHTLNIGTDIVREIKNYFYNTEQPKDSNSPIGLATLQILMGDFGEDTYGFHGNTSQSCSFTIELQGKR